MSLIRNALRYSTAPITPYYPSAIMYHPEGAYACLGTPLQAAIDDKPNGIFTAWLRVFPNRIAAENDDRRWDSYFELIANAGGAAQSNSEGIPGFAFVLDDASSQVGTIRANTNATPTATALSNATWANGFKAKGGIWYHVRYAWDNTPVGTNAKQYCLELRKALSPGDVTIQKGTTTGAAAAAFNVALSNAAGFGINVTGSNTPPCRFDCAQPTLEVGSFLDAGSNITLAASGFLDVVNNKAIDLGTGAAAYGGTVPLWFVDGDKATISQKGRTAAPFAVCMPNATTFAFTPAQTPELYDAAFGPNGPPDALPYEVWNTNDHLTGQNAATASFANNPVTNRGNPIDLGDRIWLIASISDTNSGVDRSGGWAVTQPNPINNFAIVAMTGDGNPLYNTSTYGSMNQAIFSKIADANDVTPAGNGWGNATAFGADVNAPAIAFSTGGGVSPRSARWQLIVQKQAGTIQAAASKKTGRVTGTTGTWLAPSVVAGANCLLMTGFQVYDNTAFAQGATTFHTLCPAGQNLRFKSYGNTDSKTYTLMSDEKVAAGATGARAIRIGGTVTSGGMPANAFSIALGP